MIPAENSRTASVSLSPKASTALMAGTSGCEARLRTAKRRIAEGEMSGMWRSRIPGARQGDPAENQIRHEVRETFVIRLGAQLAVESSARQARARERVTFSSNTSLELERGVEAATRYIRRQSSESVKPVGRCYRFKRCSRRKRTMARRCQEYKPATWEPQYLCSRVQPRAPCSHGHFSASSVNSGR